MFQNINTLLIIIHVNKNERIFPTYIFKQVGDLIEIL